MFHTQEKRPIKLTKPIKCTRDDAWLGEAFYFWYDINDAHDWGKKSKKRTNYYEIYSAIINCSNVLDTVFNEVSYNFWVKQIEKVSEKIIKLTGKKPTITEINSYIKEKGGWGTDIDGILFQDLPFSDGLLVKGFNYRKRIQIGAFNLNIVSNFALKFTEQC